MMMMSNALRICPLSSLLRWNKIGLFLNGLQIHKNCGAVHLNKHASAILHRIVSFLENQERLWLRYRAWCQGEVVGGGIEELVEEKDTA